MRDDAASLFSAAAAEEGIAEEAATGVATGVAAGVAAGVAVPLDVGSLTKRTFWGIASAAAGSAVAGVAGAAGETGVKAGVPLFSSDIISSSSNGSILRKNQG